MVVGREKPLFGNLGQQRLGALARVACKVRETSRGVLSSIGCHREASRESQHSESTGNRTPEPEFPRSQGYELPQCSSRLRFCVSLRVSVSFAGSGDSRSPQGGPRAVPATAAGDGPPALPPVLARRRWRAGGERQNRTCCVCSELSDMTESNLMTNSCLAYLQAICDMRSYA